MARATRPAAAPAARKTPRVALWGHFGTDNLGNECTLAAMLGALRRRLPSAPVVAIASAPEDVRQRHGIDAVCLRARSAAAALSRWPRPLRPLRRAGSEVRAWWRAARVLLRVDALLVVGTGVLTDAGEGTYGLPYELMKWSVLARWCRCQLLFVSVGAEPIRAARARRFILDALRRATYRSYRDARSRRLIESYGFAHPEDPVVPDLAFSLEVPADGSQPSVLAGRAPRVAVGLYNYRDRGADGAGAAQEYAAYLDWIGSFVLWLIGRGYGVRIIIGDFAYDEPVRADLRAALAARGVALDTQAYADEPARSYEQLLDQLRDVQFVVASRFHNVLLSLLLRKPVVSVSYDPKNDALMAQVGLGAYCQSLERFSLDTLLGQFQDLERHADALIVSIDQAVRENRERLERQYERILATMDGS